jgi:hypothetical protein
MVENVPQLQEVTRSEVVVGEDGTTTFESLAARHLLYMLQISELILKVLLSAR